MEIIQAYKCFCDVERLRILSLLKEGPLCVCHLVEILNSDQVKISKQLRYMKKQGMVEAKRCAQWMVYCLSDGENPLLDENLKCLQDCYSDELSFSQDKKKRTDIIERIRLENSACVSALCADC